jgi:hypothetical protein
MGPGLNDNRGFSGGLKGKSIGNLGEYLSSLGGLSAARHVHYHDTHRQNLPRRR